MEAGEQEAAAEETDRAEVAGEEGRMGPEAAQAIGQCPRCGALVYIVGGFCGGCEAWRQ